MVAPLVGAWIEIRSRQIYKLLLMESLPSWERGLKYLHGYGRVGCRAVAPLVGAWIEIGTGELKEEGRMSLPSWERGLKLILKQLRWACLSRSPRGSVD